MSQEKMIEEVARHHEARVQDAVDDLYDEVCCLARAIYGIRFDHVVTTRKVFFVQTSDAEPGTRMIQRRDESTYRVVVALRDDGIDDATLAWGRDEASALANLAVLLRKHSEKCVQRALSAHDLTMRIEKRSP